MKKLVCSILLFLGIFLLSGCGNKVTDQSALKNVHSTNTITWAVEGDKKLFSLIDIRDDREKGFDIDMAKAITREILGPKGQARFTLATSQSRIPLLKNGNVDAVIATLTITPERAKVISFSKPYFQAG
ncbi:MAG: transporter substrate-binding domain-containing protein, partial [Lactobacillus sp.]|nr:transporter substrate-binding domain-containing protein [Lactobacillus sp.]